MSRDTLQLDTALRDYLLEMSLREPEALRRLRERTGELDMARMQISPEQGQLMAVLMRALGARRVIEIGTFTGYSAARLALALPEDGRVITCDVSAEWTAIATEAWREAGVAERIELHLRPAIETLDQLLAQGSAGSFDFAFIDADKSSYGAYWERSVELVRSGGMVAVDNVLWEGRVIDDADHDRDTVAIRELNRRVRDDRRVEAAMVPIGDGLTLAVKL